MQICSVALSQKLQAIVSVLAYSNRAFGILAMLQTEPTHPTPLEAFYPMLSAESLKHSRQVMYTFQSSTLHHRGHRLISKTLHLVQTGITWCYI